MQPRKITRVGFRNLTLNLPAEALGGTPKAPLIKPTDELLLDWLYEHYATASPQNIALYHDVNGVLSVYHRTCAPAPYLVGVRAPETLFVSDDCRHFMRAKVNHDRNDLALSLTTRGPLDELPSPPEVVLMHLPKNPALFTAYLHQLARWVAPNVRIAAAFQTRHFTPRLLDIAAQFFGSVNQSRAYKKSRLLYLSDPKRPAVQLPETMRIEYAGQTYVQYPGVFSAGHIDYATQFLLETWSTSPMLVQLPEPTYILDCGCGNGIIGDQLLRRYSTAKLTAYDVSALAVASAKLNYAAHGQAERAKALHAGAMAGLKEPGKYDLVVTNPPFHEGHRNDISVSLTLFEQAAERIRPGGHLVVVANRHLNYLTHLRRHFDEVLVVAENQKFVVYRAGMM